MASTLASIPSGLLPQTLAGPIFTDTVSESAVQRLARRIPLSLTAATSIPVPMDRPVAGWVAEGGVKPAANIAIGVKQMTGKKVALLLPVSEEVARTNPAGLFDQLRSELPSAIARSFDYAAIHGKDLRTNAAGPWAEYLGATANSVNLGTTANSAGGLYVDLVLGEQMVVNKRFRFSGYAADPWLSPRLKLQVDTTGRPVWVDNPQAGLNAGNLAGFPAYFNEGVSGAYLRQGNRVQVITLTGTPNGGTFAISGNNATSAALAYGVSLANAQVAVRLLGGPFAAAVVTGTPGTTYTVTLGVAGVAAGALTVDGALLTAASGTPTAVIAQSPVLDSGLRAIGGDWSQAAWGSGMDITVKVSDSASYTDEAGTVHSAFQENLVLLLVEAHYGFVVGDLNAFVAYTD